MRGIDIELKTTTEETWTMLTVGGEVDLFTAPKLKEALLGLIEDGTQRIAIDLERVTFMDSTGLGVLVGALKRVREREGSLALICPQGPVLRVLELTGLHKVFSIHDTMAQATAEER